MKFYGSNDYYQKRDLSDVANILKAFLADEFVL